MVLVQFLAPMVPPIPFSGGIKSLLLGDIFSFFKATGLMILYYFCWKKNINKSLNNRYKSYIGWWMDQLFVPNPPIPTPGVRNSLLPRGLFFLSKYIFMVFNYFYPKGENGPASFSLHTFLMISIFLLKASKNPAKGASNTFKTFCLYFHIIKVQNNSCHGFQYEKQ